jgi:hypothetical protein
MSKRPLKVTIGPVIQFQEVAVALQPFTLSFTPVVITALVLFEDHLTDAVLLVEQADLLRLLLGQSWGPLVG